MVLAHLIYHFNEKQGTVLEKNNYIFDSDTTNIICDDINLSIYNYNNIITRLRKFGVIQGKIRSRTLHSIFQDIVPSDFGYTLTINFLFDEH